MRSRSTARRRSRCSAKFTRSCDRRSFRARFVPRPGCRRLASLRFNSAFRGPPWSRLSNSFSPRVARPANRGREPIRVRSSRALRGNAWPEGSGRIGREKTKGACLAPISLMSRRRATSVRSTSARTLVDARTAELWRKLSARKLRSFGRHHLGYGDPHGMPELRNSVCDYLRAARAVRCEPEQVVITAGTQQAIDIVIRVMQVRTGRSGSRIPDTP